MTNGAAKGNAIQLGYFLIAFFTIWSIRATVLSVIDERIDSPVALALYSNLVKLLIWVVPTILFVWRYRSTSPLAYLGIFVAPNLRTWLDCTGGIILFLGATLALETLFGHKAISTFPLFSRPMEILLLQFCITPLLEEVLFRGFLLRELLALVPRLLAYLTNSALFVGVHLPYWLYHTDTAPAVLINSGGVFVFSMVACWLYERSRAIWPPVLAHVANNMLAAMLVGPVLVK